MNILNTTEMEKITGGNAWICLVVAAVIVFLSGVIEGITNPERCNNIETN